MSIFVSEVATKEVLKVHQGLKSSYISYYMLKPHPLLAQIFKKNKKALVG